MNSGVAYIVDDANKQSMVNISSLDLVAKLKGKYVYGTEKQGKMISFFINGVEMDDQTAVGQYHLDHDTHISAVEVPHQPFAPVDYFKLNKSLLEEGYPRNVEIINPEFWNSKWKRGDEWKTYPPVDVNNIWSSVKPSSSRALSAPKSPPRPTQTKMRQTLLEEAAKATAAKQSSSNTRTYQSVYLCCVNGYSFKMFHKLEGKWNGEAKIVNMYVNKSTHDASFMASDQKNDKSEEKVHVTSSRLDYDPNSNSWIESQNVTSADGLSTTHHLKYVPSTDGVLVVTTDQPYLQSCLIKTSEIGQHVLVTTAINQTTGLPVMTETLTCSMDFQRRSRTIQRFDNFGNLFAVYAFNERKVIDAESGALEPFHIS